ncbi:hypothetical protein SK128_021826 [Halocaridina rubra]|uniref:Uncharacterized protein n=1 Tax=Halocaridina rubra TaxID=373956 RepID=A0AAN8ZZV6_HALRR
MNVTTSLCDKITSQLTKYIANCYPAYTPPEGIDQEEDLVNAMQAETDSSIFLSKEWLFSHQDRWPYQARVKGFDFDKPFCNRSGHR